LKLIEYMRFSFSKKLILFYITLLSISTLVIGVTGYFIAKDALKKKGEIILKNSVVMAMDIIRIQHEKVDKGLVGIAPAQEKIRNILLGPKLSDGTRKLHRRIDLGEHGYFIIYNLKGDEVMHPVLEGQNVWNVKDLKNKQRFLVQEQIYLALHGGGFMYYSWVLPGTEKIEEKISYGQYFPEWQWVVVATAYNVDFDHSSDYILLITLTLSILVIIVLSVIIFRYVNSVTKPVIDVAKGMEKVASGEFEKIGVQSSRDEIELLVDGYNDMIVSLDSAGKAIDKKNRYISYLAYNDEMTSLMNIHGLKSFVNDRINSGCGNAYLVQFDISGLKVINSTMGYEQGNEVLKLIGKYFLDTYSESQKAGRTSSNEFTVWLENVEKERIEAKVQAITESVKFFIEQNGYGQIMNMHRIMAKFPDHGSTFEELYEKTITALKVSKDRNDLSLQIYRDDMSLAVKNEVRMKRHLRNALKDHDFAAVYQKQVDHLTGAVVGVEALARWESEDLGFISPAVFVPAISQMNLIREFSEYIINTVLGNYDKLKEKYGNDVGVSLNISPSFFVDKNFYEIIKNAITSHEVPHEKVTLEITEDVFISDFDSISSTIDKLHALGIRIAIDDFGTGYSSLNYLTKISFDEMKIDKIFIDRIIEDPRAFQLLEKLCDIAEVYGYDLVAEGVETEDQLQKIKATPLRIIQGYYYSKPEPLD